LNSEWRLEGHPFADGQKRRNRKEKDNQSKQRIKKEKEEGAAQKLANARMKFAANRVAKGWCGI